MDLNKFKQEIIEKRELPSNFFNPNIHDITDISKLKNIDRAINTIERHIKENNSIVVYADVDIDGVTATLVAYQWLKHVGADVSYIHHSKSKGHGIIVPNIPQCDLLIVVDSTSSDTEKAKEVIDIGIAKDIVIIDHHEIEGGLVDNEHIILVNPFQDGCQYENKDISGCLLTWRVFDYLEKEKHPGAHKINSLLHLASVSIVSDSMNVSVMENRYYYYAGNMFDTPPFVAIDSYAMVYPSLGLALTVNPKLNAAIRDDKMQLVFDFMLSDSLEKAKILLKEISGIYDANRSAVNEAISDMRVLFRNSRLLVVQTDFKHKGYLASRLTSYENKCVIAIGDEASSHGGVSNYHGSGRALQDEELKDVINQIDFVECVGHQQAFGIKVPEKKLNNFSRALNDLDIPKPKYEYDFELDISDIDEEIIASKSYCNFLTGKGFEKISDKIDGIVIKAIGATASGNKYFNDAFDNRYSQYNNKWLNKYSVGDAVNVIGTISNETYGQKEMTVMMVDYIESSEEDWD